MTRIYHDPNTPTHIIEYARLVLEANLENNEDKKYKYIGLINDAGYKMFGNRIEKTGL